MHEIIKQVDPDYNDPYVAFVRAEPCYIKGRGARAHSDINSGDTFYVDVHRKPLNANGTTCAGCNHRHRSIDAAVKCAKALLRKAHKDGL